jgi:hypothetical protein
MGKTYSRFDRGRRNASASQQNSNAHADNNGTIFVSLSEIHISESTFDKLMARDGQQIEQYRQAYENGEEMVRVVLRPRFDGGYNVEDGRHRVIAAKLAEAGLIQALIIGAVGHDQNEDNWN